MYNIELEFKFMAQRFLLGMGLFQGWKQQDFSSRRFLEACLFYFSQTCFESEPVLSLILKVPYLTGDICDFQDDP